MVNSPLIRPYFLGVNVALGEVPLDCHDMNQIGISWNVRVLLMLLTWPGSLLCDPDDLGMSTLATYIM